jgi:cytochrome P450
MPTTIDHVPPGIDLQDPDRYVDAVPWAWFDRLREDHPVVWHDEPAPNMGFWAVTRYDDLTQIHMDWQTFSSETGAVSLEELDDEQLAIRKSMLETDPPRHTELRRICSKRLSARGVGRYEDWIRDVAREVLDRALALDGPIDFVAEISRELPIRFLCSIFTVPQEDAPQLISWGDQMIANQDPDLARVQVGVEDTEAYRLLPFRSPAALEVFAYADRQRELRAAEPADDVLQALAVAQAEGILSEQDYHNYFGVLMIAGNETTRHTITAGMRALMEHPDQLAYLREHPEAIDLATEEILRWATPVMHFRRTATRDVELRGQEIHEGDKVVTWYVSANRDPEVFPDPYRFDVTRTPNDHVTFGPGGPHFCLGAHLARLETRILFSELLPRIVSIEPAGPVERIRSNFVNGTKRMPVRIRT